MHNSMIDVKFLEAHEVDRWNELVEQNQQASIFHLFEWGDIFSYTYKYSKYNFVAKKGSKIFGALPLVHVKSKIFGNRLISLPFCECGGPIVKTTLGNQTARLTTKLLLKATVKLARAVRAEYVEIRSPQTTPPSLLRSFGYKKARGYLTFRIDLTKSLDSIWNHFNRKTRNAIRKAVKSGLHVKEVHEHRDLGAYYRLYLDTQKRLGSPPHAYKLFENLYVSLHPKNRIRILLAEHQSIPIGAIITFQLNNTIYWSSSVTNIKQRNLNPISLLLWNTINWGVEEHYKAFDLGRTRIRTGVYRFKKRWGGQKSLLNDYVYFLGSRRKELPDPIQRKYMYLSKIWSMFPTTLTREFGPKIISGIAL